MSHWIWRPLVPMGPVETVYLQPSVVQTSECLESTYSYNGRGGSYQVMKVSLDNTGIGLLFTCISGTGYTTTGK